MVRISCHRYHNHQDAAVRNAAFILNVDDFVVQDEDSVCHAQTLSYLAQTWSKQQAHAAHVRCSNSCPKTTDTERTQRSCKETRLTLHEHHLGSSRWLAFAQRLFAHTEAKNDAKKIRGI